LRELKLYVLIAHKRFGSVSSHDIEAHRYNKVVIKITFLDFRLVCITNLFDLGDSVRSGRQRQ